jgi:hypothetical protein
MIALSKDQRLEKLPTPPKSFKQELIEQIGHVKAVTEKSPELAYRWAELGVNLFNPCLGDLVRENDLEEIREAVVAFGDAQAEHWVLTILQRLENGNAAGVIDSVIAYAGDLGGAVLWGQAINQMAAIVSELERNPDRAAVAPFQLGLLRGF